MTQVVFYRGCGHLMIFVALDDSTSRQMINNPLTLITSLIVLVYGVGMFYIRTLMMVVLAVLLSNAVYAQDEEAVEVGSIYVDLKPDFVVNYGGVGKLRYLKTSITLRVEVGEGQTHIRRHTPYLRHKIVMLLSSASDEDMSSMAGRELLRQNALAAVREVLVAEEGVQHVTDLLFSSFIVQS